MASRSNPALEPPPGLIITKIQQTDAGYYTANVHLNGSHITADNRYGSWQADVPAVERIVIGELVIEGPSTRERRAEVLPHIAAALSGALATEKRRQALKEEAACA